MAHGDGTEDRSDGPARSASPEPMSTAGRDFLRSLAKEEARWMRGMVARVARDHSVEPDDLLQEMSLALLSCDVIDGGREGVRSWLTQRATWKAKDILRRELRHTSRAVPIEDVDEPPDPRPPHPPQDWTVPKWWKLSRAEAQIIVLICWRHDLSMSEFAELEDRRYDAVRKQSSRTIARIARLFDLEPEERAAFVAHRKLGSITDAAARLHISPDVLRRRLAIAETKIRRALRDRTVDADVDGNDLQGGTRHGR